MLSNLSGSDRMMAIASAVVVVLGLIAFVMDNWSTTFWLSIGGAALALVVLFLPQIAPTAKMPVTKGLALLALGGIAALGALIEALRFLGYIFANLLSISTIAFLIAVAASVAMAWFGWTAYTAERSAGAPAGSPPPPPPPA
ncbi:MAG: hypothetical protein ACRDFZ_00365 [Candidatus Limnocylindria bacterium]